MYLSDFFEGSKGYLTLQKIKQRQKTSPGTDKVRYTVSTDLGVYPL